MAEFPIVDLTASGGPTKPAPVLFDVKALKEYGYDDGIVVPKELLVEIVYHYQCMAGATRPDNQAHHLIELSNKVSDLKSWFDDYDSNSGTVGFEREDD